ncbi:LytB [Dysgonomonas capnocytophagoides]|uniref:LytB n=1 Tax=Dysgonomonas capnocytophagoides TaxID=45254 RepID=UPI003993E11C
MEVIELVNDGRCKWLESQVMNKVFPEAIRSAKSPNEPTRYMIIDWISNDNGKVGVDLKWFKKLGVPAVETFNDLPKGSNFIVVNTGYDSIVHEEKALLHRGIKIIDKPCPFVRKLRKLFENIDGTYQYVLLCEPNHIIIKNYASLFPEDMILIQMGNYKERILEQSNGKPIKFISYVTFLKKHSNQIFDFINESFPDKEHVMINTQCMWADGKISPLDEISNMPEEKLNRVKYALLIGSPGSTNKSLMSLEETIRDKGLEVVNIGSLQDFLKFQKSHKYEKILLVKSPIPNQAEKPILAYLRHGYIYSYYTLLMEKMRK